MATTTPGDAVTVRVDGPASTRVTGDQVAAVSAADGSVTAPDVAESQADRLVIAENPADARRLAIKRNTVAVLTDGSAVLGLGNPDPGVDPVAAGRHAAVVATGRSDFPNQINNVLAFPGFFRGMLDADSHHISEEVMLAAARAIADAVAPSELNASFNVPSVFDPEVAPAVATAVRNVTESARSQAE